MEKKEREEKKGEKGKLAGKSRSKGRREEDPGQGPSSRRENVWPGTEERERVVGRER